MKLEEMFERKLEEQEKSKEDEKKNISQERQASIALLKEKASKLKELSLAWQGQFEVAEGRIKEFKEASKGVTEVFDKYKEKGLVKEGKREHFITAVKAGEYGREAAEEEDSEINIREKKRKEVKAAIAEREGVPIEGKPQTLAEIRKAIKEQLPEEVAKSINFSLKSVNKENVGHTIERAVLGVEGEIKNLVKEGVIERHKNGSVDFSTEDERDMETLGKEEMKSIILEQASEPIERKRAKDFAEVELLEKDTQQMLFSEQRFPNFQGDIARTTKQLSYSSFINDLVRRLTAREQGDQVRNNLGKIAEEFSEALSYNAIMKVFSDGKPERATEETKNEISRTIRDFNNEFSKAINNKTAEIEKTMGEREGDNKRIALADTLKDELTTIKNNATAKLQELQKMPDKQKYIDNPQAEELLAKKEKWEKSQSSSRKNIWEYLNEKKANVNITANREKALAETSLDKNFLTREIQKAEAENGEVYDKVKDYYERAEKLEKEAEQVEKVMGRYGDVSTLQEEEPFLVMPKLDKEIKEWEESKEEKAKLKDEQEKVLEKYGHGRGVKSWGKGKEIEAAQQEIAKADKDIKDCNENIDKIKKIEQKIREKIAGFFAVISKGWLDNEKLSQAIFAKHGDAHALANVAFNLEHRHGDFGIISDEDVEIYKKLGWQRETLKKAAEAEEQARISLNKAKTEAAKFEKEYLS